MAEDLGNESFESDKGSGDDDDVISSTRKNLLMAQLYADSVESRNEDGKVEELFIAESTQLESADLTSSHLNTQTLLEMNDTFDKLVAWREKNAAMLFSSSTDTDTHADDKDSGCDDSANWVTEIQKLMRSEELMNIGLSRGVGDMQEQGQGQCSGLANVALTSSSLEAASRHTQTLAKLQTLLANLELARSSTSGNSSGIAALAFKDLSRLVEQDALLAKERAHHAPTKIIKLAKAEGKDNSNNHYSAKLDYGDKIGIGSTSSCSSSSGKNMNRDAESKDNRDKKTVFRNVDDKNENENENEKANEDCSGNMGMGMDNRTFNPETEGDDEEEDVSSSNNNNSKSASKYEQEQQLLLQAASDRRVDAFIADELDLHCGLTELGGQLTDFMNDLDKLFPEEAEDK